VERRGGVFDLDRTQPRILTGRLVEVSVNANIARIAHALKFFSIDSGMAPTPLHGRGVRVG
jgi:hypothetical protein